MQPGCHGSHQIVYALSVFIGPSSFGYNILYIVTHKVIYYGRFNDFTYTSQHNPPNIDDVFLDKVKLKSLSKLTQEV